MIRRSLSLATAGLCLAGTATAAPYAPFDVRSAGMGGTGVASAKTASAALFNPAMLSAQVEGDKFQFVLGAGANVADEDELFNQVDELDPALQQLDTDITALRGETISVGLAYPVGSTQYQALTAAAASAANVGNRINAVNNDSLVAGLGSGLGVGVASRNFGFGIFVSGTGNVVSTPLISGNDTSRLLRLSTLMEDTGNTGLAGISTTEFANNQDIFGGSNVDAEANDFDPQSQVNGLAVVLAEYGVGFSHQFALSSGGQLSVGATPKMVNVITYDYTENIDNFEDGDIDTREKTESVFDLDLGVVYKASADSKWQFAFVGKHLVGTTFTTDPNVTLQNGAPNLNPPKTIEIEPQLRAGVARMTERTTLAIDLDLTENSGINANTETQFLALGAEYDLKVLQLRAGYRTNLADSDISDVATVGLGLGPVDLSAVASDTTLGAYLQFGFGW